MSSSAHRTTSTSVTRARRRRVVPGLLIAVPLGGVAVAALAANVLAAPAFAATASMTAPAQYLGDAAGTVYTFTVKNTGTTNRIAAVEISRPSTEWTAVGCPAGPAGWTRTLSAASCRYVSAATAADDMAPGASRQFQLKATTTHGRYDRVGAWRVRVSRTHAFTAPPNTIVATAASPYALTTKVYTWQIVSAPISGSPVLGSCPALVKTAHAGSTRSVVVCARNHAYVRLVPIAGSSSLGGTMVAAPGTFSGGSAPARSGTFAVANWSGTTITSAVGSGKTIVTRIGSATNQTSPLATLGGYLASNALPVATADSFGGTEDGAVTGNVLGNDTDADGDALTAELGAGPAHGTLTLNPDGSFTYTPAADFNGADSFTYRVNDGFGDSALATVSLAIDAVDDGPVNTVPGAQTVAEGATLTFESATNGISVADVDAGSGDLTVTLGATNGALAPSTTTGLTSATGSGTGTLVLTGPLSAVNAALDGLTYQPTANGADTLTILTSDNGHTGSGGPLTDTDTVAITVVAVNDAPVFVKGADQTVLEDAGAQTVAGWATGISAGPADESGQAVTFDVTNDNTGLFAAQPAVAADGTLTYTPAADAFGTATVTVAARDDGGTAGGGADTSPAQTFTITVGPVNDAPSFTSGGDLPGVGEDAGAQTVSGWATGISAGPANESGQALAFDVTNSDNGLFAVQPAVAPNGDLTYTPAPNASGTATITVTLRDDGGTADSGDDTSAPATVSLTVGPINDAPSFTKGADQAILEDAGAQSVSGWATGASAGPADESGQALDYLVTSDNADLFAAQPAISPAGDLTYTPASDAFGAATVTVRLHDDGGTANGGADTSPAQTFTITVASVNDAPSFASAGNQAVNEDAGAQSVPSWASGISTGPANESGQLVSFAVTNSDNGLFAFQPAVSADGTLTYTPAPDAFGSATVTVTLTDDGGTANGGDDAADPQTFTITVNPVNDAPTFTKGADQAILEDAGAQSVSGWATAISAGPANESGQTVSFVVTNDDNTLFAAQPAISPTGDLTYTAAPDANGVATVTVSLHDDGGFANGGDDAGDAQTFTITVTPVNDTPSFTKGADESVIQDSGTQTVAGWATGISAGPADEAGQTLTFAVTAADGALFSTQPAVSPTGDLTYTPAAGVTGSTTVSVALSDDGGIANGGDDTSDVQTFTITIKLPNEVPVADATSASGNEDGGAITVTLTGHDADGDALTFEAGTATNGLVTVPGAVTCDANTPSTCTTTVTYTPNANFFGTDSFTYTVHDGTVLSASATATVDVAAVNDAPSFTPGGSPTVAEDSGAYSAPFASGISAGPANESGQTVGFDVTDNTNPGLFSTAPAISGTGTLTFTPAANANGTATVTYHATDDGGTANGGADTSAPQTFTITVTSVNDAPSFTKGADQTLAEDAGAQSVSGWATAISKGPADESGQTLAFTTSNTNNDLFSVQPGVTPTGTLVYTSAPNTYGTATVSVTLADSGGTANNGDDTSDTQTFTITVNPVNDAPVATAKSYTAHTNMKISLTGLLAGASDTADTSQEPGYTPTYTLGSITAGSGCVGCTVSNIDQATGSFDFEPPAGQTGTFTLDYRIQDSGFPGPGIQSAATPITITVSGPVIWFVSASSGDDTTGNGTLARPFATLGKAATVDAANHRIFLQPGTYAGGITLPSGVWLAGTGAKATSFDSLMGIAPPSGTIARPAVNGTAPTVQGAVTLGSGNTLRGLSLTGAPALTGSAFGTLVLGSGANADLALSSAGQALSLTSGTIDGDFASTSSSGGTNNVLLDSVATTSGTSLATGSLTGATGDGLRIVGGTGTFSYAGTVSNAAGTTVAILNKTAGTVTLSGAVSDTAGAGVALTNNGGSTINLTGGVNLSSGSSPAFAATGGGTVNVTGTANTLTSTTGTALNVANTTIGASDLTFRSISTNGAAKGIVLDNTGAVGNLVVTGNGGTCTLANTSGCTGGTIANSAGADDSSASPVGTGIVLSNTRDVSLTRMRIHDSSNYGIRGTSVTNLTVVSSVVNGTNGTNAGNPFLEGGALFTNLTGTASFTGFEVSGGFGPNIEINNSTGTLNATFDGLRLGPNSTTDGNDGLQVEGLGTSTVNVTVQNSTFTSSRGDQFQYIGDGTGGGALTFTGNTLTNSHPGIATGGGGVSLFAGGAGPVTMNVANNTLRDSVGTAWLIRKTPGNGSLTGTFNGNTVGVPGVANSGSLEGAGLDLRHAGTGLMSWTVTNNAIHQYNGQGIMIQSGDGAVASGTLNVSVSGNTVSNPGANPAMSAPTQGLHVNSGVTPGDSFVTCVNVGTNTIGGSGRNGGTDFRLRQRQATTVRLPGYSGAAGDTAAVVSFIQGKLGSPATGTASAEYPMSGGGYVGLAC